MTAGNVVRGEFALAGNGLVWTPGTLTWTFDRGADLELIGDTIGWPTEFAHKLTIHGVIDGRDKLTLLSAGVRSTSTSAFRRTRALRSTTLALGEHVDQGTRWARALYGTTNLSEWIAKSGLQAQLPEVPGEGPSGMLWAPPPRHQFKLPRADAALAGQADPSPIGYVSSWSISTNQILVINLRRRATISDLFRRYAIPLVAFTAFASDRPDSVIFEVLLNPESRERVEVWRRGLRIEPRPWEPKDGYVFWADELPRLTSALRRWWRLHAEVWPALDLFAEQITNGTTYSPARFLTLYTAMEAYCRTRFGQSNFRRLRDYAGVDEAVHGCSNPALALIGASRNYFAHLGPQHLSREQITDNLLETTRRAHALLQACLLREVGFGPRQVERLLARHHANWPIVPMDDS